MKKVFLNVFFSFILLFIFICNVDAECSYNERKKILNESKDVNVFFDVNLFSNKFILNIYNLSDNLYLVIENNYDDKIIQIDNSNMVNGIYNLDVLDIDNFIKYKINMYSKNDNCYGYLVSSKNIIKPVINKHSKKDYCKGIEDFKYCKSIFYEDVNLSELEIYNEIFSYKQSLVKVDYSDNDNFDLKSFFKDNFVYFLIGFVIILIIVIISFMYKKRGELK